jgi:glycerol-3-phosphate dehydrogenase
MTDYSGHSDLTSVTSLFEVQLSERSGLVSGTSHAEEILREYETATTTKFACYKVSKGFGNTGELSCRLICVVL